MSAFLILMCDHEDDSGLCGEQRHATTADLGQARAAAATFGWAHIDGQDLCPRHNPARQRLAVTVDAHG